MLLVQQDCTVELSSAFAVSNGNIVVEPETSPSALVAKCIRDGVATTTCLHEEPPSRMTAVAPCSTKQDLHNRGIERSTNDFNHSRALLVNAWPTIAANSRRSGKTIAEFRHRQEFYQFLHNLTYPRQREIHIITNNATVASPNTSSCTQDRPSIATYPPSHPRPDLCTKRTTMAKRIHHHSTYPSHKSLDSKTQKSLH
jgi:hypothetical protein